MSIKLYNQWDETKVIAGYTTDFDGHYKKNIPENIPHHEALGKTFGIDAGKMVRVHQAHTRDVLLVNEGNGGEGILKPALEKEYDGMVTDSKNLMICVTTADCTPVFFYDEKKQAIGIAHSGRKGTWLEIAMETVEQMKKNFGSNPKDIKCILGPYICQKHHEVNKADGEPFYERFSPEECSKILLDKGEKTYVDMGTAIKITLVRAGLKEENIYDERHCTYEDTALYSWRREHDITKHILSFIMLKG